MNYKNALSKDKVYAIINGHQSYNVDFGKILSESFNFLFKDFGMQLLLSLCIIISFFILPFLIPFLTGGWYIYIYKKRHGDFASFSDFFLGFQDFLPLLILSLIQTFFWAIAIALLIGCGYIFSDMVGIINNEDAMTFVVLLGFIMLIPFYYLVQIFFFFSTFFVLFSEMTAGEAMSASFSIAKKKFLYIFLVIFISGLIAYLGINFCYIGFLFTYPFMFIAYYIHFEHAFDIGKSGEEADMDQILEHLV